MASISITDEDILNVLTKPCPRSEFSYLSKHPQPTCLGYKRCGKCEDGRVLSSEGRRLAILFRNFNGLLYDEPPVE